MTIPLHARSVVAIDPISRGLAYVFFENGDYMDAATRGTNDTDTSILETLNEIVAGTAADVLVIEDPDDPYCRRHARMKHTLRLIAAHARKRHIAVFTVSRKEVRDSWRAKGFRNKESVAAEIAKRIPELEPFVPPPRTYPADENARVNLFDAASLALHLFDETRSASFPDERAL